MSYSQKAIENVPSDMLMTLSDSLERNEAGDFTFVGDVTVSYEDKQVLSNEMFVEERNKVLRLPSDFTFLSNDVQVQAKNGYYEVDTQNIRFTRVAFQMLQGAGNGNLESIEKDGTSAEIKGLKISTCSNVGTVWHLRAAKLRVDDHKKTASLRHLRLTVGRIPILYLPYARISKPDRQETGFQTPVADYQSRRGLSVGIPYTFRIRDDVILTMTSNYLSKRGPQLHTEVEKGLSKLDLTWIPADRAHDGTQSRKSFRVQYPTGSFSRGNRWHIGLDHSGDRGPWSIRVNIDQSSDVDYWRDFRSVRHGQGILANESTVAVQFLNDTWHANVVAQQFTSTIIADQKFERLPETNLHWTPRFGKLALETQMNYVSFNRDRGKNSVQYPQHTDLRRRHVGQLASYRHTWNAVEIAGKIGYTKSWFEFDHNKKTSEFIRTQWTQSLGASMHMVRTLVRGNSAWRQTLEPKIFLLNRDFVPAGNYPRFDETTLVFKSHRLFSDRRQSGLDHIPGARSFTVGGETDLWRVDGTRKVASAGLAWIHHFDGLYGTGLEHNQLGIDARLSLGSVGIALQHLESKSDSLANESNATIGIYGSGNFLIELAYADRSYASTRQSGFNLQKKLGVNWFIFAHHTHDLEQKRNIDRFVGLSYDNCCLNVKWMYRESIDLGLDPDSTELTFDRGLSLQLIFKGLMSAGSNIDNLIHRKSIRELF